MEFIKKKNNVSYVTPLALIGNLILQIEPVSFPSNPIKVELDFSSYARPMPIAFKAKQNIMLAKLMLSTNNLRIVKLIASKVITSASL